MPIPRLHKETSLFNRTRTFSSTFKVLADSITSLVKGTETYTDPVTGETKTNTFGTLLQQTANNVLIKATKSASTAAAGGQAVIESLINVAPEGIKIAAAHVDIEGAAIFRSGGKLAKVVTSSQTQWYSSTSASQLSGGSWTTTQPNVGAGRYLWERTVYNYSDNTQEYKPSENGVCVTAPTDISTTVDSVDVEYAQGTSATTAPSSGWSTTAPTIAPGKYLWTRTKTTYKSESVQPTYTRATCISGDNGKLVTATKDQYYLSTSDSTQSGGSWVDTQPAWAAGKHIWTRTHFTYADGTTSATSATLATAINSANAVANASVKRSTQLWYTKADTVAPAKPTSKVTSASTAGNGWRIIVPAYSATYPNYFYCWQHEHMDGSFEWSDVVFDRAATENFGQVRGAQARSQLVYRSAAAGTNSLATITTWVTQTGDVQGTWTTKRPTYDSAWPVLFTANQAQTVAQMAAGTACSCTTPLKDDTTTVIDGGHITTGTIDAKQVTVTNIDASNINTGTLDAKCIGTGSIAIGKLDSTAQFRLYRDVSFRGVCSSSESNSTKIAICECFTLATGVAITVYNTTAQTYVGALKLGVMGSGDNLYTPYSVYVGGVATSSYNQLLWAAGSSITFVFTGGHWEVADSPGTWEGGSCTVASGTAGKTASVGQCVLFKGASVKVRMSYDNTASSVMLNVQSLGAKNVYFGSTSNRPTRDNGYSWKGGSLVEFVFDGQYWRTGSRTYINGGDIVTGTIDASKVTVTNLDASKITTGTLNADRINVNAIKAAVIDAIEIRGEQIKGGTISGVVFETESSKSGTKISISEGTILYYSIDSSSYTKVPFAMSTKGSSTLSGSYIYPSVTMGFRSVDSSGFYIDQSKPRIQFYSTRDLYLYSGKYGGMYSDVVLQPDGVGIGVNDSTASWKYEILVKDDGIKFYRGNTLLQSWT